MQKTRQLQLQQPQQQQPQQNNNNNNNNNKDEIPGWVIRPLWKTNCVTFWLETATHVIYLL